MAFGFWGPKLPEIEAGAVEERLGKGEKLRLVDVREPAEYKSGHIPGAKSIPLGILPDKVKELGGEKEIILICRSGQRSAQATTFLQRQGLTGAVNMRGGMLAWRGQVKR